MEQFMPSEGVFCATIFAPITFPPSTVLVFNCDQKGTLNFIASGNVLDVNPDRIIVKRVVLSGHPFKVNKRLAVVRYMFFNKGINLSVLCKIFTNFCIFLYTNENFFYR